MAMDPPGLGICPISATIDTDRLVLRRHQSADAARVLDLRSRLEVISWLDNPPHTPMQNLEQAQRWIERSDERERADRAQAWRAIEVRESRLVVGSVQIARMERIAGGFVGEYELGWQLNPDSQGFGYATEAARAMASAAFIAGHQRLMIDMYPDNAPSAAVARRLGATELGEHDDPWYGGRSLLFTMAS